MLNRIQPLVGFIYKDVCLRESAKRDKPGRIDIQIECHEGRPGQCGECLKACPGYDLQPERAWRFVPLWGLPTYFLYSSRRVECSTHGMGVEFLPWSAGKRPVTLAMMCFLATWARRWSWLETARAFGTSWESVYRSVEWFVEWGLKHRKLEGIESIGRDEIHWGKGHGANRFLTVIYQIDATCRRLLWVGPKRTQATLKRGLAALGSEVVGGLRYVCSDMWRPYLNVIADQVGHALHVLDRFHISSHLNQAVDQVRRAESTRLAGKPQGKRLKKMRWKLLRRGSRLRGKARKQLDALIGSKLATARAWILKESFHHFWTYRSVRWAQGFLDAWCTRAMRSRLEPMRKVARMMRAHEHLLFNWFKAKGEISSAAVEGLNNKIRVLTRRSYGFRTYNPMEIALYHNLGRLPQPPVTHRFC